MKLEGNQVFHHPAGVYPQSFSQDSGLEALELKSGNEVTNGKHEDLSKSNIFGIDEYWSESGSTCSGEDYVGNNLIENQQCEHCSSKDSNEIKDKNMMDSDAAKGILCCKDNTTCFEVKGICVDEGVPLNVHISSDKENNTLTSATEEESINVIAVKGENIAPSSEASKPFKVHREDMMTVNGREDLMEANVGEDEASEAIGDESTGHTACGNTVKGSGVQSLISCAESPKCEEAATYVLMESQDCGVVLGPYDIKNNTMNNQENTKTISALHDESKNTNLLATETAENGGVTFNIDALATSSNVKEETSKDRSSDNPVKLDKSKADAASNRHMESLEDRHDHGESSFSYTGLAPISGSITYSGPIAFSGSLSLRSDSSTTSTRSFAFPILQNEWNSSPVRMAKGDRRCPRKRRSWRYGLCCRF